MGTENDDKAAAAEKASNLRAIFEILSYIHADALKDNHKELADRIEFALNLAEELIKGGNGSGASVQDQAGADIATAVITQPPAPTATQ